MESAALRTPRHKTRPVEKQLMLAGPAGKIEARIIPPVAGSRYPAVAVICHPHPLHGGNLDNKVTATLAKTMSALGGETEDLLTVIHEAQRLYPQRELWLAGFSFGAYVALRASQCIAVDRLITVAPPVNLYDLSDFTPPECPWLLVQGTDDEVVPYKQVLKWATRLYPAPQTVYLDGVGHYFHGKLTTLQTVITDSIIAHSTARPIAKLA